MNTPTQAPEAEMMSDEEAGPAVRAMVDALTRPPAPAQEVVTLRRVWLEAVLRELEDAQAGISATSPSQNIRMLREALAQPKEDLWAVHSVGPREWYPAFSKEDAERHAQDIRDACDQVKTNMAARGENTDHYPEIVVNVIPSPWEPVEHFERLAGLWHEEAEDLRGTLLEEREAATAGEQSTGSIDA